MWRAPGWQLGWAWMLQDSRRGCFGLQMLKDVNVRMLGGLGFWWWEIVNVECAKMRVWMVNVDRFKCWKSQATRLKVSFILSSNADWRNVWMLKDRFLLSKDPSVECSNIQKGMLDMKNLWMLLIKWIEYWVSKCLLACRELEKKCYISWNMTQMNFNGLTPCLLNVLFYLIYLFIFLRGWVQGCVILLYISCGS